MLGQRYVADAVVGHAAQDVAGRFRGADVQVRVYLHRVGIDDLTAQLLGDGGGEVALTRSGRTAYDDDGNGHVRSHMTNVRT